MTSLAAHFQAETGDPRSPRRRTYIGATIVHGHEMMTVDCVVVDSSDTGVKISVPPMTMLPERFWMLDRRIALAHEARLVWRRGGFAGIEFVGRRELDTVSDPALRILRRIWLEKAPRAGY